MHSPTAFLRIPRVEPERQAPGRRIRHWHEYEHPLPDPRAAEQGARCMDCGVPWCHGYCPVHNQIPEWNALVSEDEWRAAWEQLESTNNFPELTGRLCPAPCEDACTLRLSGSPVTIRAIELAIVEHAWQRGWVRPQRPSSASLDAPAGQVSVVGSGPAGLACAQQLARAGHAVTVYEAAPKIGGLLRYGIPDFRLEKRILDRRLDQMREEGVRFRTGVRVGADLPARDLMTEGGVLVLACGSSTPRDVTVPGRGLGGVHFALDYLSGQNRSLDRGMERGRYMDACDLDVVVIGGGDTGSDCVGTAIRQGARSVTQIQYHAEPPHQGDVLTHWPEPVPELKPNDHEAEGGRRIWGWETVAFRADGERVAGVDLQRLHWSRADDGRWRREPVTGESRRLPAQLVLIAIGYRHPAHGDVIAELDLSLDGRGNIAAGDGDYRASREGVFACGDARRGQSLIVWAIREGRQCAESVDTYVRGGSELPRV
ncbi:glutamate synthase subunit beta [Imhoffiella purpurea]|uniref:Glutamate synthase [NADPH] small chain n=1 Tax=Imhoffiella purpurea TaxID=1249627 RepID=W9VWI1_9GAMM|nr:glutamate synthase subunit beta [Imhoffiella purpurea]EXJ14795.1 Glutamate synthase [NADPH] small chain [Imhoffiella purpurea]